MELKVTWTSALELCVAGTSQVTWQARQAMPVQQYYLAQVERVEETLQKGIQRTVAEMARGKVTSAARQAQGLRRPCPLSQRSGAMESHGRGLMSQTKKPPVGQALKLLVRKEEKGMP